MKAICSLLICGNAASAAKLQAKRSSQVDADSAIQPTVAAGSSEVVSTKPLKKVTSEQQPSTKALAGDTITVTSINFLGQQMNGLEFQISEKIWTDGYDEILKEFKKIKVGDVLDLGLEAVWKKRAPLPISEQGGTSSVNIDAVAKLEPKRDQSIFDVLSDRAFAEKFLEEDNKRDTNRVNLIVYGLELYSKRELTNPNLDGSNWLKYMGDATTGLSDFGTYDEYPELLFWDIACNLAAAPIQVESREPKADPAQGKLKDQYKTLLDHSPFNPSNVKLQVEKLMSRALDMDFIPQSHEVRQLDAVKTQLEKGGVVIGVQEFPISDKWIALKQVCDLLGLTAIAPKSVSQSVGFLISNDIWKATSTTKFQPWKVQSSDAEGELSRIAGELAKSSPGEQLWFDPANKTFRDFSLGSAKILKNPAEWYKKLLKSILTTSQKTAYIDVGDELRFVNIHCKEFKEEEGQKVLAAYVKAISRKDDPGGARTVFVMMDSNAPNKKMSEAFEAAMKSHGFNVITKANAFMTTRKKRSLLHGQIYDEKKVNKEVSAHKDFVLVLPGKGNEWQPSQEPKVYPDFTKAEMDTVFLPNAEWPTDHCMTKAYFGGGKIPPPLQGARKAGANTKGTDEGMASAKSSANPHSVMLGLSLLSLVIRFA
eukprot:gnl/MRDRNA2_/MRDRNA2_84536_c0_seq1.p1 gnl/MRDRNA2_/MRDRNA2_84536_c0~~gnl/MRDRNA2_/MRDRNA2_84536_c0_seq1.p1  ORF type:complete len:652 (+),score=141.60 gnl/MRDRNA2_/MRDRNA2_84536_c0_seq1:83-2038(+)